MAKRLKILDSHFVTKFPKLPWDPSLEQYRNKSKKLNAQQTLKAYFGSQLQGIIKARKIISDSKIFNRLENLESPRNVLREKGIDRLFQTYFQLHSTYQKDKQDPIQKLQIIEILGQVQTGLATLLIVHILLYIDSLQSVGTQKHLELIHRAYYFQDYGCFSMTQMGHGSNVAKVETTATYDHSTREFIINSPTATSAKWWIGAAAKNANKSVLFAQLFVNKENKGVHLFVVDIRDQNWDVCQGVTIGDCGPKIGNHVIDNGFILFNNYRVPYDSLLDRYSQISPEGKFKSPIKSKAKRMGISMAGLVRGRLFIGVGSQVVLRTALTTTLRYSAVRKQFGQTVEQPILDYQLHKYRLIPILANTLALRSGCNYIMENYKGFRFSLEKNPESMEVTEFHVNLSSLKTLASKYVISGIQTCREACGGHGYSAYSFLGNHRNDVDVHATWEGDSNVLIQQVGKFLLKLVQNLIKGKHNTLPRFDFIKFNPEELHSFRAEFSETSHLKNPELLISLLEFKVNFLLQACVIQLQNNAANASSMFQAWNETQVFFLQDLSLAYSELFLSVELFKMCKKVQDKETSEAFLTYFFIYSLRCIRDSLDMYLQGCFEKHQAQVVRSAFIEVINEGCKSAISMIDIIGVPDYILQSPLGRRDGQVYKHYIECVQSDPTTYEKADWTQKLQELRRKGTEKRNSNQKEVRFNKF